MDAGFDDMSRREKSLKNGISFSVPCVVQGELVQSNWTSPVGAQRDR
jgi:hypothetical protein